MGELIKTVLVLVGFFLMLSGAALRFKNQETPLDSSDYILFSLTIFMVAGVVGELLKKRKV